MNVALRRTVLIVALLNFTYFGTEFAVALRIGSVSLFADSVDFLEDAFVNLLIFFALAWTAARCIQASSKASVRAIARPSKTRSIALPTRAPTRSSWSRKG